jgi:hypothetical protein
MESIMRFRHASTGQTSEGALDAAEAGSAPRPSWRERGLGWIGRGRELGWIGRGRGLGWIGRGRELGWIGRGRELGWIGRGRGLGYLTWPRAWAVAASAVAVLALAGMAAAGVFSGTGSAPAPGRALGKKAADAVAGPAAARSAAAQAAAAAPLRTSCTSVAHIGDSTSADLISSATLPDQAQQLPAQYSDVGVQHQLMDASGGRSIVEELPGQVNGYNVALNWRNQGYRGCWVFALGTNDAANVSVGSSVGIAARISEMMSVAHGEPVMWVNTVTQLTSGPWSEANEQAWDNALVSALARYPNMRIFNWAAVAQPGWFLSDGIHYDSAGCAARAQAIADALARAFPAHGHSTGQIVS